MNDFHRQPRPRVRGNQNWLFPAVLIGVLAGALLGAFLPDFMLSIALVGRVFLGMIVLVAVPLAVSQLALSLNNPREHIRRPAVQPNVLPQALVAAASLVALSILFVFITSSLGGLGVFSVLFSHLNPEQLVTSSPIGGIFMVLALAAMMAAFMGTMGDRVKPLVTFFNRVARASVRSFRLLLIIAPLGLFSFIGSQVAVLSLGGTSSVGLTVVSITLAAAAFALYAVVVLATDWVVGLMRPPRRDTRSYERDRDRRPSSPRRFDSNRPVAGRGPARDNSFQRPARPPRERDREKERSPFDMGVSSTPVLDSAVMPTAGRPASRVETSRSENQPSDDARPQRPAQNDQREGRTDRDRQRPEYRDHGPRGPRGGFRDRGPRGPRDDRRGPDRGGFRPDQREDPRPPAEEESIEHRSAPAPVAPPERPDRTAMASDLARISEQLGKPNTVERTMASQESSSDRPRQETRSTPIITPPSPERTDSRPRREDEHETKEPAEMHYGRSTHRRHEQRADHDQPLPGIETPTTDLAIDKFETDDMSFGRGKRRKTPR